MPASQPQSIPFVDFPTCTGYMVLVFVLFFSSKGMSHLLQYSCNTYPYTRYTCTRTHTHSHMDICMHMHTSTCVHMRTYAHTHTHSLACPHTCKHTHTHTHTHTHCLSVTSWTLLTISCEGYHRWSKPRVTNASLRWWMFEGWPCRFERWEGSWTTARCERHETKQVRQQMLHVGMFFQVGCILCSSLEKRQERRRCNNKIMGC